jgi:hypothetical protein
MITLNIMFKIYYLKIFYHFFNLQVVVVAGGENTSIVKLDSVELLFLNDNSGRCLM